MKILAELLVILAFFLHEVLSETCLIYAYGSYTNAECESCCDAGIRRRCCSDKPVQQKSSTSVAGIIFGCIVALIFLAGVCGSVSRIFTRCKLRSSRTTDQSTETPSFDDSVHSDQDVQVEEPKPPAYTEYYPPPPYSAIVDEPPPCFKHQGGESCDCVNSEGLPTPTGESPPPYSRRSLPLVVTWTASECES